MMKFQIVNLTPAFEADLKAMDASTDSEARADFLLKYHQPLMALDEVRNVDGSPAKALALVDLGQLADADPAAHKAVAMHPQDAGAWLALAQIDFANGDNKATVEDAGRSLKFKKTPEAVSLRAKAAKVFEKK